MREIEFLVLYRDGGLAPIKETIRDEKGEDKVDAWLKAIRESVPKGKSDVLHIWIPGEHFDGDKQKIVPDEECDQERDEMGFMDCVFCDDKLHCHLMDDKMTYKNHRQCDECKMHMTLSEARSFMVDELFHARHLPMSFGHALVLLKAGYKVRRKGWNGKGIYLELQRPDEHSKMTLPYIYIVTTDLESDNPDAPRGVVPWLASQTDMLSDDWEVIDE